MKKNFCAFILKNFLLYYINCNFINEECFNLNKTAVSFKTDINFKEEETGYAPLVEELMNYKINPCIGFHIPGHNRGNAVYTPFREIVGQDVLSVDTTDEFDRLGTLHPPSGKIKEAMELAASCWGAERTFFVTSGSTISNLGIAFGVLNPKDKIIAARNSHRSILTGIIISGANPKWLMPYKINDWAIFGAIEPCDIENYLNEHNDIKFVWVTNPTYEGVISDIKKISDICHSHNVPLIVDEAHGSLWNFHPAFPKTALYYGADAVVHSLHKTGGALTQASMLHIGKNSLIDCGRVEHALKLLHTTSPSLLLLASLDAARANLSSKTGFKLIENAIENAKFFRKRASELKGVSVLGENDSVLTDITKIFVKVEGLCGKTLESILEYEYNIEIESACDEGVLILSNIGNTRAEFEYLLSAFEQISEKNYLDLPDVKEVKFMPLTVPKIAMNPREAYFAKKKCVKKENTIGKIAAEVIALCPPGISVLLPGEIITEEHLPYLCDYDVIEVVSE